MHYCKIALIKLWNVLLLRCVSCIIKIYLWNIIYFYFTVNCILCTCLCTLIKVFFYDSSTHFWAIISSEGDLLEFCYIYLLEGGRMTSVKSVSSRVKILLQHKNFRKILLKALFFTGLRIFNKPENIKLLLNTSKYYTNIYDIVIK